MTKLKIKLPTGSIRYVTKVLSNDAEYSIYKTRGLDFTIENYLKLESAILLNDAPVSIIN